MNWSISYVYQNICLSPEPTDDVPRNVIVSPSVMLISVDRSENMPVVDGGMVIPKPAATPLIIKSKPVETLAVFCGKLNLNLRIVESPRIGHLTKVSVVTNDAITPPRAVVYLAVASEGNVRLPPATCVNEPVSSFIMEARTDELIPPVPVPVTNLTL